MPRRHLRPGSSSARKQVGMPKRWVAAGTGAAGAFPVAVTGAAGAAGDAVAGVAGFEQAPQPAASVAKTSAAAPPKPDVNVR